MADLEFHWKRAEEIIKALVERVQKQREGRIPVLDPAAWAELNLLICILLISGDGREELLKKYCGRVLSDGHEQLPRE